MQVKNIFDHEKVDRLRVDGANYVLVAGTTDVKSDPVHAVNSQAISFLVLLGAMAASSTVDVKVQGSPTTTDGDFVDLEDTAFTQAGAADDYGMLGVTIHEPARYEYYRLAFTRGDGGNSEIQGVLAFTEPRVKPVEQSTTVPGGFKAAPEFHADPAAGTA